MAKRAHIVRPPAMGTAPGDVCLSGMHQFDAYKQAERRMPAISVLVDGERMATVNTSGYDAVSVHIHGTRIDDEFATLEMSGGTYPEKGESTHLIWINGHELRPGQQIEVRFQETGETWPPGKTIEELFPARKDAEESVDFKPREAIFVELRAKPSRREGFSFQLRSSAGASFAGSTGPMDHGFGFGLLWNSNRPERARHSLHAYTLGELESRSPLRYFIREYVEASYAVTLQVAT